jgi:Cu-Zn family superoxide dismutase
MRKTLLVPIICTLAAACSPKQTTAPEAATAPTAEAAPPAPAPAESAGAVHHVTLAPTQGHTAAGALELTAADGGVAIKGHIMGLTPGAEQGFHIHEKGDCSAPDGSSAGGHFNPGMQAHGKPGDTAPHHAGDMLNLRADAQGMAEVDSHVDGVTLTGSGDTDVVGKSIVIHEKLDDYMTQPSGASGARIACGVIQ